jgi:hypothetical protein
MNGMPSAAVMSRKPAGHLDDQRLALDHAGTGNQEERPVGADLESAELHAVARPGPQCRAVFARGADEAGEQRMAVARRRGELRMELARHEPGMIRAAR